MKEMQIDGKRVLDVDRAAVPFKQLVSSDKNELDALRAALTRSGFKRALEVPGYAWYFP
mgnify:CR=1 FL=1